MKEKFDISVSMLCWAYNEEELIASFLSRAIQLLEQTVENYEIVLIDDGSTDKTFEIASTFKKQCPSLKIIQNEKNLNVGLSCLKAIQHAEKEILFWQTIDWSYDIINLRSHLEYLKSFDIVQGVRVALIDGKSNILNPLKEFFNLIKPEDLLRRSDSIKSTIVSIINYLLIRLLFRVPVSDFQNVTFYRTKWIQSIHFESRSSFLNPEGLIKSFWNGKSIIEVPIRFIPRQKGTAKGVSLKTITKSFFDILFLWVQWIICGKRQYTHKGMIKRLLLK